MATINCPVCETVAELESDPATQTENYTCPQCGQYALTHLLIQSGALGFVPDHRFRLKCLLAERRVHCLPQILLSGEDGIERGTKIDEFLKGFPREPLEFFDRALVNLGKLTGHPVGHITISPDLPSVCFTRQRHELNRMLRQMGAEGWISPNDPTDLSPSVYIVTPEGWRRIEKLRSPGRDSRQAFVAMWFDPTRRVYFEEGFLPAIEADGKTKALRIDRKEHNQKIDDEIVAEIRRSRYLVADATGKNVGVYFEAGFAYGLGLPVIWCIDKKEMDEDGLHFDTRQYNHIVYADAADLKAKLSNRIRATIV